jgi:GDP-D-mannose 3',5'-epimerase
MRSNFTGPVNIGSEEMVTINQLVAMIAKISKKQININNIKGPEGVRGRNSDNKLIQDKLHWSPSKPLSWGLEKTFFWIESQLLNAEKI